MDERKNVCDKNGVSEKTATILVVEDEVQVLDLAEMILRQEGYTVLKASTPSEAVDTARRHKDRIDLLLSDVIMPEMDGKALQQKIEAIQPNLKTVFMSGYAEDVIVEKNLGINADDLIRKPFRVQTFTERVAAALDKLPGA
ncbi:MAG: response regulator [Thermodesulfobacteriota bacterium]